MGVELLQTKSEWKIGQEIKFRNTIKLQALLKESGMSMNIDGCGCCGSPTFRFKSQSLKIKDENFVFDTEWNQEQIKEHLNIDWEI